MIDTELKTENKIIDYTNIAKTYYAYADNNKKTWFITPTKKEPFKGLLLLFELGCIDSELSLFFPDKSCPVVGTILSDIHGNRLEVVTCEWV